jgi:hypothetical protein
MATATQTDPTAARVSTLVEGWNELRSTDGVNDYDKAMFFKNIRDNNYARRGRDEQFKRDVNTYLHGISGAKALAYVLMVNRFTDDRDWINLGGFASLNYLHGLNITARQRNRLVQAAHDKADTDNQPVTVQIIRKMARERNYESRRGAPPRSRMAVNRDTLARFIYDNYEGEVPQRVLDAMPRNLRDQYE